MSAREAGDSVGLAYPSPLLPLTVRRSAWARPLVGEDLHSLRAEVPVAYLRCWRPLKVEVIPQDGMRFDRRATQFDGLGRPMQIIETRAQNP